MNSSESLVYTPKWYELGDADVPQIALAYGAVAMATVWVLESLVHRVLFSASLDFSLSEAAALVTFKGCTWLDLITWVRSRQWLGERDRSTNRSIKHLNRRALFGVVLRMLVILLEILIIYASVPRKIVIMENQVASSELNFRNEGVPLFKDVRTMRINQGNSPCFQDQLLYRGFSPSALRLVCVVSRSIKGKTKFSPLRKLGYSAPREGEIRFELRRLHGTQALRVFSEHDNTGYYFMHTIQSIATIEAEPSSNVALTLSLPIDIAAQARDAIFRQPRYNNICKYEGSNKTNVVIICNTKSLPQSAFFSQVFLIDLQRQISTKKAPAKIDKSTIRYRVQKGFMVIGSVSRPRLGIIPAIILLSALWAVDLAIRFIIGSENIMVKLFHLCKEAAGVDCLSNPLYTEKQHIPFWKTKGVENDRIGYLHKGSAIYGLEDAVRVS